MNADMPQMIASQYGTATTGGMVGFTGLAGCDGIEETTTELRRAHAIQQDARLFSFFQNVQPSTKHTQPMSQRRIVQVFIADAEPSVPLEHALLHKTEPAFSDSTDQELYFEIPVAELLKAHNEKRKKWLDKDATRKAGKDVFLEPVKIRDLKMVVVTIAQF